MKINVTGQLARDAGRREESGRAPRERVRRTSAARCGAFREFDSSVGQRRRRVGFSGKRPKNPMAEKQRRSVQSHTSLFSQIIIQYNWHGLQVQSTLQNYAITNILKLSILRASFASTDSRTILEMLYQSIMFTSKSIISIEKLL